MSWLTDEDERRRSAGARATREKKSKADARDPLRDLVGRWLEGRRCAAADCLDALGSMTKANAAEHILCATDGLGIRAGESGERSMYEETHERLRSGTKVGTVAHLQHVLGRET